MIKYTNQSPYILGHVQTLPDADVLRRPAPAAPVDQGNGNTHRADSVRHGDQEAEHRAVAQAIWRTFGKYLLARYLKVILRFLFWGAAGERRALSDSITTSETRFMGGCVLWNWTRLELKISTPHSNSRLSRLIAVQVIAVSNLS